MTVGFARQLVGLATVAVWVGLIGCGSRVLLRIDYERTEGERAVQEAQRASSEAARRELRERERALETFAPACECELKGGTQ